MRTTIVLPDDLFRRAKAEAALEGRTLTSLIEEALRELLGALPGQEGRVALPVDRRGGALPTFRGNGLRVDLDLSDNAAVRDFLDEDVNDRD